MTTQSGSLSALRGWMAALAACSVFFGSAGALPADQEYRHFFGVHASPDNVADILRFCKQMSYHYVVYKGGMENDANSADMRFYLETPEYGCYPFSPVMDTTRTFTAQQQADYERYIPWKSRDPFPSNLATGWTYRAGRFNLIADYQQQRIIDELVDKIIARARGIERPDRNFRFGGVAWDVPQLPGDFWSGVSGSNGLPTGPGAQVTLAYWTGGDSSLMHPGITHEYATFSDGRAAFYKKLKQEIWKIWPDAKFMVEPYDFVLYWLQDIAPRADKDTLVQGVFTSSEQWGTTFAVNPVFTALYYRGLISRQTSGCSVPNAGDSDSHNRMMAGYAGRYREWFNWFLRFNASSVTLSQVTPAEKLLRVMPNWDNIAGVDSAQRTYTYADTSYTSPNSHTDRSVVYTRNPETRKLFVIFLKDTGKVVLAPNENVLAAQRTDTKLLLESGDGMADLTITAGTVKLRDPARIGQCYILTTDGVSNSRGGARTGRGISEAWPKGSIQVRAGAIEIHPASTQGLMRATISAMDGSVVGHLISTSGPVRWKTTHPGAYCVRMEDRRGSTMARTVVVSPW